MSHEGGTAPSDGMGLEWRERVLNGVLTWMAILGAPPTLIGGWRLSVDRPDVSIIAALAYGGILFLAVMRGIDFRVRAGCLIGTIYVGAVLALYNNGVASQGSVLLFGAITFAGVLFDLRTSVRILALSVVTMTLFAAAFVDGRLVGPSVSVAPSTMLDVWVSRVLVFGIVAAGVVVSLTFLLRQLSDSLSTSRRLVEDLERNQIMLAKAEEIAGMGAWSWDSDSGKVSGSEHYHRLLGREPGESATDLDGNLIHPNDLERFMEAQQRLTREGDFNDEFRVVLHDGEERILRIQARTQFDRAGKLRHVDGLAQDVTEERASESERRALEIQLLQAQKMESVGQLAGGVAHDFNNLLTVIGGYSEILLDGAGDDEPSRDAATQVQVAVQRAAELTRKLLAFSRKQVLRDEVLDLNDVVSGIESMLERLIGDQIEIQIDLDPRAGRIEADPGQLEQAIVNLAINARDATPNGGVLLISTAAIELPNEGRPEPESGADGPCVRLSITDTGEGMSEEVVNRIFDPFFTTKEVGKGTGLGMAMVYGFVRQSGGSIEVESNPGRGTRFDIFFPCVDEEVAPKALPQSELAGEPIPKLTILVAEDEEAVRNLVRTTFEGEGHEVHVADGGLSALELASRFDGEIDVLITDMVMPGMMGIELACELRKTRPGIGVLMISGYPTRSDPSEPQIPPDAAFLQKPYNSTLLLEKVYEIVKDQPKVDSSN